MDLEKVVYPLSRYWYGGDYHFYYAYGNTPPQDFLQNISAEKEPSILVLGCGDIRSCFYSLWKNFDVKGPARFDGVHFFLDDNNAAILARNILFLYLCLKMPEEEIPMKKWLSGMWAIWYCHELFQEHYDMLNQALRELCSFSDSWSSKDNPLHSLVKFNSQATKREVKRMWKMWLHQAVNVSSVTEMLFSRAAKLAMHNQVRKMCREDNVSSFVDGLTEVPFEKNSKVTPKIKQAQKSEVLNYIVSGSVYAEAVLGLELRSSQTFVNFTFYEMEDGTYNLHYHSLPFSCFYQSIEFTRKCFSDASHVHLLVGNECFLAQPFLANSVQQFCLWLCSSRKVLRSVSKVRFTFDVSHALTLCYELKNSRKACSFGRYDMIYSSNLMDHLGPPNLILSAIPLLKDSGLLFTSTLLKDIFSSFEKYLALSFGFDCKYFPVLLGVRCINHEGERYASPVTIKPCPLSLKGEGVVLKEKLLVWEKVPSGCIPLVFFGRPLTTPLAEVLVRHIEVSVFPLLKTPEFFQMVNLQCVETAVKVIQTFMSNTCADYSPDFWKPLSSLMQQHIKPYLSCLQTQLFLHGIHMHLTVSDKDCAMCLQAPLPDSIGLFSTTFYLKEDCKNPTFMAFVHKEMVDDAEVLSKIATSNGDVHVFDCVSPSCGDANFLQLYFYAPLNLVHQDYKVTVVVSNLTSVGNVISNKMHLPTQPLQALQASFVSCIFFQPDTSKSDTLNFQRFGTVVSHESDGDISTVEIGLSRPALGTSSKLQPVRVSSDTIRLSYGKNSCQLKFPYPVVYDRVDIKVKKSDCVMSIQCPRDVQQFVEEKPLFVVNPDKELALSSITLSNSALVSLCGQQFTFSERQIMDATGRDLTKMLPLSRVKESLLILFQRNDTFVSFLHPTLGVVALILVNQRLFDYENRVPVIDLAFCFLEMSFVRVVAAAWVRITRNQAWNIKIDDEELELLKSVFGYFACRTHGTCKTSRSSSRFNVLSEQRIQQYFTRAVVSLLLCDPDHYTGKVIMGKLPKNAIPQMSPHGGCAKDKVNPRSTSDSDSTTTRVSCAFCGQSTMKLMSCARCKKVKYCGKDCQRKHWKTHKLSCK